MGTMTFAELKSELDFLLRRRNDMDATDTTRVGRWVNSAYLYMCHPSVHLFKEMKDVSNTTTLVTGTNEYSIQTLDSNTVVAARFVTYIQSATYTNTTNKRKVFPREMRQLERKTLSNGPPVEYAVDGQTLFINGVPRSTENGHILRIGYYKEPTILSGDSSVTVLGGYFDRALLKFAQAFAEEDLQMRDLALQTLRSATQLLNNAASEDMLEGEDTGHQVEVMTQPAQGIM